MNMANKRPVTTKRILEIAFGILLFGIIAAMRLAPAGIRDDSGEAYILMACLLAIGSGLLYFGLFEGRNPEDQAVKATGKK
jgi:prolipoprotein diacylglyceryltransferase